VVGGGIESLSDIARAEVWRATEPPDDTGAAKPWEAVVGGGGCK
jgi:hypothetical protein